MPNVTFSQSIIEIMAKQIPLTQGLFTTVDDADFDWLNQWKWYAAKNEKTFYACRNEGVFPFKKIIYMHIVIISTPEGMKTDHRDHDGLNNQRYNLRKSTHAQNRQNSQIQRNNTSGYKGVDWSKRNKKYRARIKVNGKYIHLGYFDNLIDAANAYNEAAKKYYGDYASLNNMEAPATNNL